uniref:Uncharacterized protein n=1 Tax=Avena sativa TaxID=4498 RepID=A0ACD5Y9E4_AVESA
MDRGQLQAFSRATLLGLVLFSAATWVLHGFSCLRGFLLVSLPSAASAIVTPKQCFFVFCNIIVVFLATESKLSRKGARSPPSGEDDDVDVVIPELDVFAPSIKENHAAAAVCMRTQQQLDECEKEEDASSTTTLGEDEALLEEVMRKEEDCEEEATELPAVDELNRRVEDFIARFNMERQLEAPRMVVCF